MMKDVKILKRLGSAGKSWKARGREEASLSGKPDCQSWLFSPYTLSLPSLTADASFSPGLLGFSPVTAGVRAKVLFQARQ